jgi:hypothetical protein
MQRDKVSHYGVSNLKDLDTDSEGNLKFCHRVTRELLFFFLRFTYIRLFRFLMSLILCIQLYPPLTYK